MSVAAIGAAVIVAGGTAYAASSASKTADKQMQAQRDLASETGQVSDASGQYSKQALLYDFLAGKQQMELNRRSAEDALALYPRIAEAERAATTGQRQQDVRDFGKFGPRLQRALDKINPGWADASNRLQSLLSGAGARTPLLEQMNDQAMNAGPSAINQLLEENALRELGLGGQLGADEQRMIRQDTRAAASSRGLLGADQATIDEVLNLDGARRSRMLERSAYAQGVQGSLLQELMANRGFAAQTEGLNQSALGMEQGFTLDAMRAQQGRLDPILAILNQRTPVGPTSGAALLQSGPNTVGSSQALMASLLGYGSDLNNTNYNAEAAARISGANNKAAMNGALIQAGGQLAGQAIQSYAGRGTTIPNAGNVPGYSYTKAGGYKAV